MMRYILEQIHKDMERIEKDERYQAEPAQVQINAPLALIQVEMTAQMKVLKKYEKMIYADFF